MIKMKTYSWILLLIVFSITLTNINIIEHSAKFPINNRILKKQDTSAYELVWEENFHGSTLNTDVWNYETSIGPWNWGQNQELQHYREENVAVGPDGEGNSALILTAKRETSGSYQFTSGRIYTKDKLHVLYGRIEARIKLPVLADGLWPAFWLLGTENNWPACGEIDVLEAGHAQGISAGTQERTFNGALHWDHNGDYAGYGYQHTEDAGVSLYNYNRFILEWTPAGIQCFFNDETEPYFSMSFYEDSEEFYSWPHYLILNLAVGGSFPGILNPDDITAPFPAKMYVDYIRVYQKQGEGFIQAKQYPLSPNGDIFGVFTDNPEITDKFQLTNIGNGIVIDENTLVPLNNSPSFEGDSVLGYFGRRDYFRMKITSAVAINLSHYSSGYLKFNLRTNSTQNFAIGLTDNLGNEERIWFNTSNDPYGFQRDGLWHNISLPLHELFVNDFNETGVMALFMIHGMGPLENILIDNIYYSTNLADIPNNLLNPQRNDAFLMQNFAIDANYYGIFTENPNIDTYLSLNDSNGYIYIWDDSVFESYSLPYEGDNVLSYQATSSGQWGFGIMDDYGHDLSHFKEGTLAFSIKTSSAGNFTVKIIGINEIAELQFIDGNDPQGFLRDGAWHRIILPLSDFDLALSAVYTPFYVEGDSFMSIAFDDILYTQNLTQPENPNAPEQEPVDDDSTDDDSADDDSDRLISGFSAVFLVTSVGMVAYLLMFSSKMRRS